MYFTINLLILNRKNFINLSGLLFGVLPNEQAGVFQKAITFLLSFPSLRVSQYEFRVQTFHS